MKPLSFHCYCQQGFTTDIQSEFECNMVHVKSSKFDKIKFKHVFISENNSYIISKFYIIELESIQKKGITQMSK
jgi:hypothetical protein